MFRWSMVLAVGLVFAVAGWAAAANAGKGAKAKPKLVGTIDKVEKDKIVVKPKTAKRVTAEPVEFSIDENTVVKVDGKIAQVSDLNPGMQVTVTPAKGKADTISATSKLPKPGNRNKNKNKNAGGN